MSQQLRNTRTPQQQAVVDQLVERYNINGSKVLFLNEKNPNEPWLRGKLLAAIARQSGLFKSILVKYDQFIAPLSQVVYQGEVMDLDDHLFSLPGVGTHGEKMANSEDEVNEHDLAESRALKSTLELAGFDPLDPASVVHLGELMPRVPGEAEAESRLNDLARIHILAKEKGLIIEGARMDGKDDASRYRKFLLDKYGINTAAGFDPLQRKSLIEALERYEADEFAELAEAERKAS